MSLGTPFRDLPIRHKLRAIILIISGVALLGACAAFLIHQWVSSRNALARQVEIMAEIVGDQSTAAVEFDQPAQAATLLRSLKAERQIVVAAVYTREGRLFASYLREGADPSSLPAHPAGDGSSYERGDLLVTTPLRSGADRIGTFYIRSDLSDAYRRLTVSLGMVGLILLGAAVAIMILSRKLGGLVTEPVLRLAEVVQAVSKERNYSIRVEGSSRDELGRLIEGFNDMLSQIQTRDAALAEGRNQLEQRVQDRTRELEKEVVERKAAEKLLQEKDARLTEAQELARLGSWEWTLATNKVAWSDEVYRIFGILPAKFGGSYEDFLSFAHPDDRAALRKELDAAGSTREPFTLDYRIIRPEGAVRYLHTQGKVVLDEQGRPLRIVGTLQDITERKLTDQAIQALNRQLQARMADLAAVNQELEGFSYSVSHDLRAPLRAISGFSKMLLEDCGDQLNADGLKYLDVIRENTRKMGQLIDDLLAFSRLNRKSVEAATVDLDGMAKEVFQELQEQNPERRLELQIGSLPAGRGDGPMLRQVLVNLLSNAVKYSRGKDPALIRMGAESREKETIYHVQDNGVGFDMAYVNKLFGVFQRLHSAKEFEGTGVGLALVQRIIQRHGGRVWAEGKLNEGATFFFALPKNGAPTPGP